MALQPDFEAGLTPCGSLIISKNLPKSPAGDVGKADKLAACRHERSEDREP